MCDETTLVVVPAEDRYPETKGLSEHLLTDLARILESILETAGTGRLVEACGRLSAALEAARPPAADIPAGLRADIHLVAVLLAFPTWEEVVRWTATLNVDLRDLTERELGHIEQVSLKLVQLWRTQGSGPTYRNEAGIRYSIRDVWDWRRRGRQSMTAQGKRRGNRRDPI